MKPLAYVMRPSHYDDIVGQTHLVGENGVLRRMLEKKHLFSFILYGSPGCGKTTIAEATCKMAGYPWYRFNASTDTKDKLKQIVNEARFNEATLIIVDEIHRMKKDIQDFLLPYVEDGTLIMIGLTTVNPYHAVNPAIRSRVHIYKLHDLTNDDLAEIIRRATKQLEFKGKIPDDVINYLIQLSGGEIRTLINNFEALLTVCQDEDIDLEKAQSVLLKPVINIDASDDNYFDTLSGLQKSIRGSDVDASLHYLAKLIVADDLQSLSRRLLAIAYEDIGLANPGIGPRVKAAVDAARELGNPEARLPLSVIVIEMALSPKSNSAMLAVDAALADIEKGKGGTLPLHLKNQYSFDPRQTPYLYPHDYPNAWVNQQYLPDALVGSKYYHPKDSSKFEQSLKERYEQIEAWKAKADKQKK
ncbi:MAG TPA: replication-associated recombination protein A [Bacilli bacterium]|jgi:putative ATPase|nr:MAG: Replication-associated recombination protein A [Tenericutes bacterium ADurb.Bin140]HOE77429.1 replication-associated recombination protein A [Bacilli bacterium]HOR96611.1 replication-associated recombination protein A [Bacilli bacterium]HPK58292.1 replication-associated recombination protein A [Bacilli bacterium]HRU49040.1 replication-associated recombination protein A [Bacilli bacterium]